jgi:hypothetical protein
VEYRDEGDLQAADDTSRRRGSKTLRQRLVYSAVGRRARERTRQRQLLAGSHVDELTDEIWLRVQSDRECHTVAIDQWNAGCLAREFEKRIVEYAHGARIVLSSARVYTAHCTDSRTRALRGDLELDDEQRAGFLAWRALRRADQIPRQ